MKGVQLMKRFTVCMLCLLVLLTMAVPEVLSLDSQTASQGGNVIQLGQMNTGPTSYLGAYGSRVAVAALGGMVQPTLPGQKGPFNLSQRMGMPGKFGFNSTYKPMYDVGAYSRIKPLYEIPNFLKPKPLYNIEAYSRIKAPNAIP